MSDIDFLPLEYRQQHARRQVKPWRIVVVAMFSGLLATAAFGQLQIRRHTEKDLLAIAPYYDDAVRLKDKLNKCKSDLQAAQGDADLFTYLRHPWPRTQLLAEVAQLLPKEIELLQVQIAAGQASDLPAATSAAKTGKPEEAKKLAPAVQDLQRLREECDRTPTLVQLSGSTADAAVLHRYLAALGKSDLFAKAELHSIASAETPAGTVLRFQATLQVRPGYGQSGGPDGKTREGHP